MGAWCSAQLSDGEVPADVARMLAGVSDSIDRLLTTGMLERVGDGFLIHDYLKYNPSAAQVRRERKRKSRAGIAGAKARWQDDGRSHGTPHPGGIGSSMLPSRPDPVPIPSPDQTRTDWIPDSITADAVEVVSDFDRWWAAYPRKVGKADAQKAWKCASRPPVAEMLAALDWQCTCEDWTKGGGRFVPHPGTYLRAGRWADEPRRTGNTAVIMDWYEKNKGATP
jgi:hypothetical protein